MGKNNNKVTSDQPAAGAGVASAAAPAPASPKAPPPEMRMLSDIERAEAKALLVEKQLMEARKATLMAQQEAIRLEKQVVALREENLNLRATGHNAEAARTDKERVEWLTAHGVQKDDKADLLADRLLIQRGAAAKA